MDSGHRVYVEGEHRVCDFELKTMYYIFNLILIFNFVLFFFGITIEANIIRPATLAKEPQ